MAEIHDWATTAAGNNTGATPDFPVEGWAPSSVNDTMRENMAAEARLFEANRGTVVTAGTGNAYTLTLSMSIPAFADLPRLLFKANRANTGAATLAVNALAAKAIVGNDGTALVANDILLNQVVEVVYESVGDHYRIVSHATADSITNTKLRDSAALSVIGRSANSVGDPADIAAATDGHVLRRSGTTLGFGQVVQAGIAAAAVGQAQLKTTTASDGTLVANGVSATVTLTGGTYAWWTAGSSAANTAGFNFGASDPAAGVIGIYNTDSTNRTFNHDERYVQASPPYTHGPLFVTLMLDKLGNVLNIAVAPDPVWAYHGPTDITPQYFRNGKAYRKVKRYEGMALRQFLSDPLRKRRFLAGDVLVEEVEQEITLAYKDSDMNVMPHHWVYNPPGYFTDRTIVMLEPGTSLMIKLYEMLEQSHAREVKDLIRDGYLTIGNEPLSVNPAPRGVMVSRAGWKLT